MGVITDLLNQRRRATATESNTRFFQLPPWPAALAWLNTCQGQNWNHGLRRTKNYIWLMLMKPAKKDSICFKQSKGHNTKHSGVSCFRSRRCTNRQVSWISHKNLVFAFTLSDNSPFIFLSTPILRLYTSICLFTLNVFPPFFFQPQNLPSVLHYPKISCGIKQQANLLMLHVIFSPMCVSESDWMGQAEITLHLINDSTAEEKGVTTRITLTVYTNRQN